MIPAADGSPCIYIQSDDVVIDGMAVIYGNGIMTPFDQAYDSIVVQNVYVDYSMIGILLNATGLQVRDSYVGYCMAGIATMGDNSVIADNTVNSTDIMLGIACIGNGGQITGNTVNTTEIDLMGIVYAGNGGLVDGNLINQSGWSSDGASGYALAGSDNRLTNNKIMALGMYNDINVGNLMLGPTDSVPSYYYSSINNVVSGNVVNSTYSEYAVLIQGDSNTLSDNEFNIPVEYSTALEYLGNHGTATGNTFNFTNFDVPIYDSEFAACSAGVPEMLTAFQFSAPEIASEYDSIIYVEGAYATIADNTVLNPTGGYMAGSVDAAYAPTYTGIEIDGAFSTVDGNYLENVFKGIDIDGYKATVTDNTVNNSEYYSSYGHNIYVYGDDSKVIGNTLLNNEDYSAYEAIYMDEASGVTISDNNITNAYYGIYVYGGDYGLGSNYVIENNTVTIDEDYGSYYGIYAEYANNVLIKGNRLLVIEGYTSEGIYTYDCSGVQIVDNYVENSAYCLDMEYGSGTGALIQNNTVITTDYSYADGIYVYDIGDGLIIADNRILGTGDVLWYYGMYVDDVGKTVIRNNTITNAYYGIYFYGDETAAIDSVIEDNSIVTALDEYSEYGIYLEYANSMTVRGNNITNEENYWYNGIYVWECGLLTIEDNIIKNSEYGMDIEAGCAPHYGLTIVGNTVANTVEMNMEDAIYAYYANRATINDNVIWSENGTWDTGICLEDGYSGLIDNNTVSDAWLGIQYENDDYYSDKAGLDLRNAGVKAYIKPDPKSKPHDGQQLIVASAAGSEPASDWCTIQNNKVDLTGLDEYHYEFADGSDGAIGIVYAGQTGYVGHNAIVGDEYSSAGIVGYVDNVSVVANTVSGFNQTIMAPMPEEEPLPIYSAALVFEAFNSGTSQGNLYLASNVLENNSVQMVVDCMTVFDLDGANTVTVLDNDSLKTVVSSNVMDKAYWIVDANGDLKLVNYVYAFDMYDAIVVYGDGDLADSYADLGAGDKVVEYSMNTYTYSLVPGWNLISVPLNVDDNGVESFFPTDVLEGIEVIWGWDESAQNYVLYSPDPNEPFYGAPYNYPHLTEIVPGDGYWVYLETA